MTRAARAVAVVTVLALAACSDSPTAPSDADTDTSPIVSPQTVTFAGAVGAGGSSSRTFTAQLAGTASATVSAIAPATPLTIGLGIPRADGLGCLLARSAVAIGGAAAQVSAAVDAGAFCVQVFAPSDAADATTFTVTLVHP